MHEVARIFLPLLLLTSNSFCFGPNDLPDGSGSYESSGNSLIEEDGIQIIPLPEKDSSDDKILGKDDYKGTQLLIVTGIESHQLHYSHLPNKQACPFIYFRKI